MIKKQPKTIPWIDMSRFIQGSREDRLQTAMQFGQSLHGIGFVAVSHIGIHRDTIDQSFVLAERYFSQPEAVKLTHQMAGGHHGFVPFGTEHAKYTNVMDLKEFYQTTGPTHPETLWPDVPGFKSTMLKLYLELENAMKLCLQATAIYLGYRDSQEETILSDMMGTGHGVMRILHYPPVDPGLAPPGAVRSAPHEDLGFMTVIPRTTAPGLQVKDKNGEWLDVTVPDDAAIINSGDALQHITNGIIPSTTHRVINPVRQDFSHRYSIPFFCNLPFHTIMRVLDKCRQGSAENTLPPDITFGAFMRKRYDEIGLK